MSTFRPIVTTPDETHQYISGSVGQASEAVAEYIGQALNQRTLGAQTERDRSPGEDPGGCKTNWHHHLPHQPHLQ